MVTPHIAYVWGGGGGVPRWLDVLSAGVKLDHYHPGVSAGAHLLT